MATLFFEIISSSSEKRWYGSRLISSNTCDRMTKRILSTWNFTESFVIMRMDLCTVSLNKFNSWSTRTKILSISCYMGCLKITNELRFTRNLMWGLMTSSWALCMMFRIDLVHAGIFEFKSSNLPGASKSLVTIQWWNIIRFLTRLEQIT